MRRTSLKQKVVVGCILFTVILTASMGVSGYYQYYKNMMQKYRDYAGTVVEIAERVLEKYQMDELIEKRSMDGGYGSIRTELNAIKENSDIAYIFVVYFEDAKDPDSMRFAINGARQEELDAAESETEIYSYMGEVCEEADFDQEMRRIYLESISRMDKGLAYHDNITKEYGHMLTCFKLIDNEAGEPVGILSVDLDVNDIETNMRSYVLWMVAIAFVQMLLLLLVFISYFHKFVTRPITEIAGSAADFVKRLEENASPEELHYERVKISSQDEVGRLAGDVAHMADCVKTYMQNLEGITAEKERISAELNVATSIQSSMLPRIFPAFPERTEFDIYAKLKVANEMGGSFYDLFLVDQSHLAVVIAEIGGRGIPAALLMVITKTLIKNYTQLGYSPDRVLAETNNQLSDSSGGMTATAFLGIADLGSGVFTYANAGHCVPLLKHAGREFERLPGRDCFVLGSMEGVPYWQQSVQLVQGDLLFLYTRGLTEAENGAQLQYSQEHMKMRLDQAMGEAYELPDIVEVMERDVEEFMDGAARRQDIAMLLFRYFGT